ncbi:MAG: hypothetical protein GY898_01120 [Proteobacteria bacterium]|nr:hypothetical protein [Pseudomonadota bacterium]
MIPAVALVDESFHRSWGLWLQAPIVLLVVVCTARALRDAVAGAAWSRSAVVLALIAPLVIGVLLPQREYHFAGHEGAYGELLDGELPETGDLSGHRTMAVPAALAWTLGAVLPGEPSRTAWLFANRAALALLLLALGVAAALLAGEDPEAQRRAMLLAVVGALACPPLLGWSATGFFIVPALSFGAIALALGLAGHAAPALAWGSLALASRMETAPLLFAGVAVLGWRRWRDLPRDRGGVLALMGALGVLAWQTFGLSQKRSELPLEDVRPDPTVILENLSLLPLGGPWLTLPTVAVLVLFAVVAGKVLPATAARRGEAAVGFAAGLALVQPAFLVDVGARHFLVAVLLIVVLVAAAGARATGPGAPRPRPSGAVLVLLAVSLAVPSVLGVRDLAARYMAGADSYLPAWVAKADAGTTGDVGSVLEDRCYLVVPGGRSAYRGTRDSGDVREIHRAALALGAGWCVQWAVGGDAEFSGDTRAERLDRAIAVLDLEPVGWVKPAPGSERRWMIFEPSK